MTGRVEREALATALRERNRRNAREDLIVYATRVMPFYRVSWHHREIANALMMVERGEIDRLMVHAPPRHGKLVADDVPVLTARGWRGHGELAPGDYVTHPDTTLTRVVAVSEPGEASREVAFSNGCRIAVHPNHEWRVWDSASWRWRVMETAEIEREPSRDSFRVRAVGGGERMVSIEAVREIDPLPGKCIQVAAPDGLYCVGTEQVATHNSLLVSVLFCGWYMGRNPTNEIIAASYGTELVAGFGTRLRNMMAGPEQVDIFGKKSRLSTDTRARDRWLTEAGGVYRAAGVGAGITGFGAHLIVIDDPVKSREEAESQGMREKVWDWYQNDLYTRRMKGGAIVIIQCMTGDTPVMMACGAERPLRDIVPGDRVATYDNGRLTTATVRNHRSNGLDTVWTIRTTSGITVRANERHPFLVSQDGEMTWIRTRDLRRGHEIVRVNGGSGGARPASGRGAISLSGAGDIAHRTTTRSDGPMECARRLLEPVLNLVSAPNSSIAMASPLPTIEVYWNSRAACAPYAGVTPQTPGSRSIGAERSASITATIPERFGAFCATTATLLSEAARRLRPWKRQPPTSDFTLDRIEAIEPGGVEEVFDVQIDGTENFIANGLVSHNTRWHEDDLSGRLLEEMAKGGDQWHHLHLPAINKEGEALWPEEYPIQDLERTRLVVGPRAWQALYQGDPTPEEGNYFEAAWLKEYGKLAEVSRMRIYGASDYAVTEDDGDYTVHIVIGVDENNVIWVLDLWRKQASSDIWIESFIDLVSRWKPLMWAEESGQIKSSVGPFLVKRMKERMTYCARKQFTSAKDKQQRARSIQARMAMGMVLFPSIAPWWPEMRDELLKFPLAKNDDMVDTLSLIGRLLDVIIAGSGIPEPDGPQKMLTVGNVVPEGFEQVTYSEIVAATRMKNAQRRRRIGRSGI